MRTPRNYDGTKVPAKQLKELLPQFVADMKAPTRDLLEKIKGEWFLALGEKMGPLTEVVSFVDGILMVKVKSSTLYSLLCQHEKPKLLRLLQQKFPVRDMKFRVG
jgi:hypothetical protein